MSVVEPEARSADEDCPVGCVYALYGWQQEGNSPKYCRYEMHRRSGGSNVVRQGERALERKETSQYVLPAEDEVKGTICQRYDRVACHVNTAVFRGFTYKGRTLLISCNNVLPY